MPNITGNSKYQIPYKKKIPKNHVKVGQTYLAESELFQSLIEVVVENKLENAAVAKINFCYDQDDDRKQIELDDVVVISYKKLYEVTR